MKNATGTIASNGVEHLELCLFVYLTFFFCMFQQFILLVGLNRVRHTVFHLLYSSCLRSNVLESPPCFSTQAPEFHFHCT